jgi:tRNA-splicing ligase RtcB
MSFEYIKGAHGGQIKAWIEGVDLEEAARRQLDNVAALPFIHKHVAIMPDVHWGMGATIGSVIPTKGAVIPAAVGVDIGCGMIAQRTTLTASDLPDSLSVLRSDIEARIPHGRTDDGGENDRGAWHDAPKQAEALWSDEGGAGLRAGLASIIEKHPKLGQGWMVRGPRHLGTLGTGNHFVEVCLDQEARVWVMLHSGSRGVGNRIGTYFIELAKRDMRRWFINLPDDNLAYFPEGTQHFDDYVEAVGWAQDYARANRHLMLGAALDALAVAVPKPFSCDVAAINCHHNYVARETHFGAEVLVTRKGAVRAGEGELGIIPGSMGTRSYIVRGKGNRESFCSCSHGAGRRMSRGAAKKAFTLDDHARATAHVECRKDAEVIDETPMAYKDIDAVIAAQADLVDVVHTLRQVVCVKG